MNGNTALYFLAAVATVMVIYEKLRPATVLPEVRDWWTRAIGANVGQLVVVIVAGFTWNRWLQGYSLFHAAHWNDGVAVLVTYVVSTFLFYWWHRVRHESAFWWRWAHQIHHSVSRLEILASFYKHPFEITLDSILSAVIVFPLMGCSPWQAAFYTVLIGLGEMFYHWNIHTPRWVGVWFQRPESHRIHHQRERHTKNYGDLPLWDYLFGTYSNPKHADTIACGFAEERETRVGEMLVGKEVDVTRRPEPLDFRPACWGCRKKHLCQSALTRPEGKRSAPMAAPVGTLRLSIWGDWKL
jgi:sterol desaturase/sphingolipid hydroxylase (fatty acid hydroxylase superfamily)